MTAFESDGVVQLLQRLIQFNTSNPPGNEAECIRFLNNLLHEAGIETQIFALDPERPNLIAYLPGQARTAPLLLYGHVDVVSVEKQAWQQPPFGGEIVDGYVWGRGALDMKCGIAMMVGALIRAKNGPMPPGDIILAIVSDEEKGSTYGAKFLIQNHANLFKGIRYALGEFGGFSLHIGEKRFYPIMVAEKLPCMIEASIWGRTGYPSLSIRGGAMANLGKALKCLDQKRTPLHVTNIARQTIQKIAGELRFPQNLILRQLLTPGLSSIVLKMFGPQGEVFEPILHNTVNATAISGADESFILPEKIFVNLACLLLPGFSPDDMKSEIRAIVGNEVQLEVKYVDGKLFDNPDMGLFDTLAGVITEVDPEGVPLPILLPVPTDGRFFSQLGIQTYGFLPMNLPKGFNFWQTIHAGDERIPVSALNFGTEAIYKAIQRFI